MHRLKLLRPTVWEEIHLQENSLYDLWPLGQGHAKYNSVPSTSCNLCSYKVWSSLIRKYNIWPWVKVTISVAQYLYIMWPMQLHSLKLLRLKGIKETKHLLENTLFDLWDHTKCCPLNYVTYAVTKFEVARSNGLGGTTFTRNSMDAQTLTHGRTDAQTDGQTEGRRTDFGTKLIYPVFEKKRMYN